MSDFKEEREERGLLEELSNSVKEWGTQTLIVAGGAIVAWRIIRMITRRKKTRPEVYNIVDADYESDPKNAKKIIIQKASGTTSTIFDTLKAEIGIILASVIREKVMEYFSQFEAAKNKNKDEEDS